MKLNKKEQLNVIRALTLAINHQKPTYTFRETMFDLRKRIEQTKKGE